MNIYSVIGDISHNLAIILLLLKMLKTRSCAGISGKSQICFTLVFVTRYLDLFTVFISYYLSIMKTFYISSSLVTVYLIYVKFKSTYDSNHDTFCMELLIVTAAWLAFMFHYMFSFLEVLWTFSIYLESVAILPQLFMISKIGEVETTVSYYLFALGSYRAMYISNWIYRYSSEGFYDLISIVSGVVQTFIYGAFFVLYMTNGLWILKNMSANCSYFVSDDTDAGDNVEKGAAESISTDTDTQTLKPVPIDIPKLAPLITPSISAEKIMTEKIMTENQI